MDLDTSARTRPVKRKINTTSSAPGASASKKTGAIRLKRPTISEDTNNNNNNSEEKNSEISESTENSEGNPVLEEKQ